jgi:ATP-dependent Lhr-like helicase
MLDAAAIARVFDEVRPDWRDADELHDALLTTGFLVADDATIGSEAFAVLSRAGRVTVGRVPPESDAIAGGPAGTRLLIAAERLPEMLAIHPAAVLEPPIVAPPSRLRTWSRAEAIVELLRGRVAMTGPITAATLASSLAIAEAEADRALLVLEGEGTVLRGSFTPVRRKADTTMPGQGKGFAMSEPAGRVEWCDRRLLARIHQHTLSRLRAEIAPVSAAEFMRFLFAWQHVEPGSQLIGPEGLRAVVAQLDGVELPARAWERDVLPARVDRYDPAMLDTLCLTGDVAWARLSSGPTQVVGATPIAVYMRANRTLNATTPSAGPSQAAARRNGDPPLTGASGAPSAVLEHLRTRGASFATELESACGLTADDVRAALTELVAAGAVSSDGFAGLRTIIGTRPTTATGRWFAVGGLGEPAAETVAWTLLRRYGVVFRRLIIRETTAVTWRELVHVYRRLEARGEIRGGRFVSGMSGEQFAVPDAVERLREVRRTPADDRLVTISAADPLNLTGIITPGERLRAVASNRVVYLRGVPVSAMEGDMLRVLAPVEPSLARVVAEAAAGRRVPVLSGYVGRA